MIAGGLRKQIHSSWLIAWLCGGIVIGVIAAGSLGGRATLSVAWLLSGILLASLGFIRRQVWVISLMICAGVVIGLWRGVYSQQETEPIVKAVGTTVTISGIVKEDVDKGDRGQLIIRLGKLRVGEQESGGSIWVKTESKTDIHRSDEVIVKGVLTEGFGSFTASMRHATIRHVKRPVPGDVALRVRDAFAVGVERAISEPESSLGLGYLVGQRRGLPDDLDAALVAAGLTHIVVASGYNLTILVRLARRFFERVSKYLSFLSASAMIIGFISITGMSPSMSRAGLVAGLSLLAWYYGRRFHPLVLLPFAMAVTVLVQPSYAWGDLGWQLSFAAFAGVMICAPLIQAYFFGDRPERTLRRIFIETVSAQLLTLPILLLSFGSFSLVSPVANLLILPLVPFAMLLTFIAGLTGLFIPSVATIVGTPAEWVLIYMTSVASFSGNLSWATQDMPITWAAFGALYLAIVVMMVYMRHATKLRLDRTSLVE